MIFSGRHYSAQIRVYSEMFEPIPEEVLARVAETGNAPAFLDALCEAVDSKTPIKDWTPFVTESQRFSEPTAQAAPSAAQA